MSLMFRIVILSRKKLVYNKEKLVIINHRPYNIKNMDNKFKSIFTKLPEILSSCDDLGENFEKILVELKPYVDYEFAYVCYLNAGSANIQYRKVDEKAKTKLAPIPEQVTMINFPEIIKTKLYNSKGILFDEKNSIFKAAEFNSTSSNYLITKLALKDTVFGFLLLSRSVKKPFTKEELELADTFSSIVSYSIKDSELTSVFKLQLRALQDSLVEKTMAFATIKKQNAKIIEADKIKNEFLANISHELRTPLNAIIGFSEALSMKIFGELTEKQDEYVSDIHVSGLHLLGMINEILEISKIEAKALKLALSRFNLQTSLNEVTNIVRPLANKKQIELVKTTKDFLEIEADYQKVQQILYNLLSNAIKFTKENGKIEIGYTSNKTSVTIFVKDNGIGIDPKYHGKIFGKFVQLNNIYSKKESSTGLGLTITKELTELHGGKISFESRVDEGTTFFVKLPLKTKKKKDL